MLTVYLKPTDKCNLNCLHCFIPDKNKRSNNVLSISDIDVIASKIKGLLNGKNAVNVVWHGGECTLVGKEFFIASKPIFDYYANQGGYSLYHSLQSNIIGIDESWIELIKTMFYGAIGTSYDPDIRLINGSHEKFKERWFENLNLLKNNDIYVCVNITIVKSLAEKGVNNFFDLLDEINAGEYHIERFKLRGNGSKNAKVFYMNDHEFYSFLTDIAEKYFKDLSLSKINYLLNPIDALYMNITKERGVSCWEGNCMSNSITINPDGTVANCPDVAVNNGELFGNILKDDVSKIFSSKNRIKLIALQKSFLCDCEHITVCNGGCPLHFQGGDQKSCRGFFTMLRHFRNVYNLTSFFGQPPATKPYGL